MKNSELKLILLACIISITSEVCGQDMLILPMPGQKITPAKPNTQQATPQPAPKTVPTVTTPTTNYSQPSKQQKPSAQSPRNNGINANGTILPMPMPNSGKKSPATAQPPINSNPNATVAKPTSGSNIIAVPSQTQQPTTQQNISGNQLLIAIPATNKPANSQIQEDDFIPPPPPPKPVTSQPAKAVAAQPPTPAPAQAENQEDDLSSFFNDTDFPMPPDESTASVNGENVEDLLPPTQQETTVSSNTTGESITVYPKDTGSAIFMVMKSWKCDDYDAEKLIQQALEVYGKESDDVFQITGLDNLAKGFAVSIEEEDITLDELMDILASKSGNDWGADIPNKMIYVYPKGIKTESYVSWE